MLDTLNGKLNTLQVTMACSSESAETTSKVSTGVFALSGVATVGSLLVPGVNLLVLGSLAAGCLTAGTTALVGGYYNSSYQELIKTVGQLMANLNEKLKEMKIIKDRIDEMATKAASLHSQHIEADAYVSDSEFD